MQVKDRMLKALMIVVVVAAALWVIGLLSVIGNIYISNAIPHSFSDWIVSVQIGSSYWPGHQAHSTLFYEARFHVFTAILISAGVLSAIYLKRARQGVDPNNRA